MLKKITIAIFLASFVLLACNAKGSSDKEKKSSAGKEAKSSANKTTNEVSYAFGLAVGSDLKQVGMTFDYDAFVEGMRDSMEDREAKMTLDEAITKMQEAFKEIMAKQGEENLAKEEVFLAENAKKPGITSTASGLQYEVVKQGSGPKPSAADTVKVNYEGSLIDGTVFDSSYTNGEPVQFSLAQVIPGWTEGIQLMPLGSTFRFFIPSKLAYGAQGAGGGMIPPNSLLIFEVEFLEIIK